MKFILKVLIYLFFFIAFTLTIDFLKFPETYITTWKYQLQEDIKSGDAAAIEYYQEHYINKGRDLFK